MFWELIWLTANLFNLSSSRFFLLLPNKDPSPPAKAPIPPPISPPIGPKAIPAVAPVKAPEAVLPPTLVLPASYPLKLSALLNKSPFDKALKSYCGKSGTCILPKNWFPNWANPPAAPT